MNVDIVIPARYESTRFPGKPLALIDGIPMIERVYRQASKSKLARSVIVATDDKRIFDLVTDFGGTAMLTSSNHATGTDRLAEVANRLSDCQIIVNVQGDEPLISPESIDAAIRPLLENKETVMSTIAYPVEDSTEFESPQLVKVVVDLQGFALYFSRYPIPFHRDSESSNYPRLGHAGLYAYTSDCLQRLASLAPTPMENAEKLEQLRALENGIRIKVVVREHRSPGVDVPADVKKIEALLRNESVVTPGSPEIQVVS